MAISRIEKCFQAKAEQGKAAFVAYICAGDPNYEASLAASRALLASGADVLELGMPFSDPLADGPVNQAAAQRALEGGMTVDRCFELAAELRKESEAPIIFYTYYNLVFRRGHEKFAADAKAAGVDGVLVLDCPPEEATEWITTSRAHDLANIFIVAPTTPEERLAVIAEAASGFIYYVSQMGVTGERASVADSVGEAVATIKRHTKLPVVVGFGVSKSEHVEAIGASADGVVVGSALVKQVEANKDKPSAIADALTAKMGELLGVS